MGMNSAPKPRPTRATRIFLSDAMVKLPLSGVGSLQNGDRTLGPHFETVQVPCKIVRQRGKGKSAAGPVCRFHYGGTEDTEHINRRVLELSRPRLQSLPEPLVRLDGLLEADQAVAVG